MKSCVLITATLIITVQAQSTFTVQPVSVIQAEGLEAVFECLHPEASQYSWFVNGSIDSDPNFPLEDASISGGLKGSPVTLTIPARPEHNNAVVQCRANIEVGNDLTTGVRSVNATLTVYGIAIDVSTDGDTITLSWVNQPFTTNVTYCVDVTQIFAPTENSALVSSVCGQDEVFSFSHHDHGPCDRFNFTVTPTNGENNGTSSEPATEYFRKAKGGVTDIRVVRGQMEENNITIFLEVPDCYVPTQDYSVQNSEGAISAFFKNSVITFTSSSDSRESVTVALTDSNGVQLLFEDISFRTNDIHKVTATSCSQPNCVNVSLTFIEGSSSPGGLVIVLPTQENGFFDYSSAVYMFLSRDMLEGNSVVVTRGRNKVFAFDVEDNGILREPVTYAATTVTVNVTGDELTTNYPTENDNIQVTRSMDGVVIVTSSDDSLVYLVIVHSVNSPDKLRVRTINTPARTANITADGVEDVYVVVFSWEQGQSFLNATVSLSSLLPQFQMATTATVSSGSNSNLISTVAMSPNGQNIASVVIGVVVGCLITIGM